MSDQHKNNARRAPSGGRKYASSMGERLAGLFASLFFSVPTATLIWLGVNTSLARRGGFIETHYLWMSICALALLALVSPRLYLGMMGGLWRWLLWLRGLLF